MGQFDAQIALAQQAIKDNGQAVIWRQLNRTADVGEPWKVASGNVDYSPFICFFPVNKQTRETLHYIAGSNELKDGSVIGLMGAVNFVPSLADVVIRDGKQLNIASIEVLAPNGQAILYTIEFKG
jgi:hypothetical protein